MKIFSDYTLESGDFLSLFQHILPISYTSYVLSAFLNEKPLANT